MTRKIVLPPAPVARKDANGAYLPPEQTPSLPPAPEVEKPQVPRLSFDDILRLQWLALERTSQKLARDSVHGLERDQIASLALLTKLTLDLKSKENEILERLTPEELAELAQKAGDE